jgi:ribosome assembly protein YihI (activator of Der GTPase)
MTVATTQYRISYSGNGSTTAFSFPYVFFDGADLTVILVSSAGVETAQTITTDYTVSGGSGASGAVTMVAAPAAGETLVIVREQPFTQTVLDLVENDPLPSATLEEAIDRTVIMAQQNNGQLARALRQPEGDTVAIERLPASGTRATKVLAFDADGDPVASTSTLSEIESGAANAATSASAAAGSAADAATAKTAAETAQAAAETAQGLAETAQAAAEAATSSKADDDLSNVDPATGRTALGLVIGTDVLAPNGDGSSLTGITTGASADELARIKWLEDNLALNTIRDIVDAGWTIQEMVDGFVDEFNDETGVDTADSTNETYDAAGDYYHNPRTFGAESGGSAYDPDSEWSQEANAFDGTTSQAGAASAFIVSADTSEHILGYDLGAGNGKAVQDVTIYAPNNTGLFGSGSSFNYRLLGSNDGSTWAELAADTSAGNLSTSQTKTLTSTDQVTDYRYIAVGLQSNATSNINVAELEFSIQTSPPPNMTLVSEVETADAQPDTARAVLVVQPVDSVTINTDLICEITRDDSTTWTAGTLVEEADYDANSKVYTTTDVDLTAQDPGTSMRIRVRTLNNKEIRVHAWIIQWR